jgi:hypothetical protein
VYSTCIHCHRSLGHNAAIEHFPVGRTLAFDAAKGRLWVVCRSCRRWNLTPLEERWEAIEEAEKAFRDSPLKKATENIAVARVADGADLVRVGNAGRRELAVWRYAGSIARRWRRRGLPLTVGGTIAFAGQFSLTSGGGDHGLLVWGGLIAAGAAIAGTTAAMMRKVTSVRLAMPDGAVRPVSANEAGEMALSITEGRWGIRWRQGAEPAGEDAALPFLRGILTVANFSGARPAVVTEATQLLHRHEHPENFMRRLAIAADRTGLRQLDEIPDAARIALEMALHHHVEDRALEGELELLRAEWELAEEIAAIADGMFLPKGVTDRLERLRGDSR